MREKKMSSKIDKRMQQAKELTKDDVEEIKVLEESKGKEVIDD